MQLLSLAPALGPWAAPRATPRCSLSLSISPSSSTPSIASVRPATPGDKYEAGKLGSILITAFYGEHEAWHGPIAWAQRRVIEADIFSDLSSRVSFYDKARELGLPHRGNVLIADSADGEPSGFVDVGLPLFDMATRAFKLPPRPEGYSADWGTATPPAHELRPYVSNLAVSESVRRQGIGRRLMEECEAEVRGWGPEHEFIWLEVSVDNEPAISFYTNLGYEQVEETSGREIKKKTFGYELMNVKRALMRKALS